MTTAAESGGLSQGLPPGDLEAERRPDMDLVGGSAFFSGTQLNHSQISGAMYGAPHAGLPSNLNPWPDVYFVSTILACVIS